MSFFYNVLSLLLALDLLVWALIARKMPRTASRWLRGALHGFFLMQIALLGVLLRAFMSGRGGHYWLLTTPLLFLVYLWHLLLLPLVLVGSLLGLTGETALALFRRLQSSPALPAPPPDDNGISRRNFLGTLAALAPPLLTFSLSAYAGSQLGHFRIRHLTLHLPGLPEGLDGMTIAHLSDLHVGPFTHDTMLKSIVEATNNLKADLTLFTGDLINSDGSWLPQAIETLRALRPAPVLCEGNHDKCFGFHGSFVQQVKAAGFCLLINENVTRLVRGVPVQLLGLRWEGPMNWQNRHDERALALSMEQLLAQRDPAAFPILLAHHPHAWDYCGDLPLMLSGHTHGGQLMLDARHGFGPAMFRYWTGLYTQPAGTVLPAKTLVVSNGIGNWFPLRTHAPAELLHLTLRRG